MSDRIAIMNDGRIVQEGTPREIYTRPASVFASDFIGETNLLHGTVGAAASRTAVLVSLSPDGARSTREPMPPSRPARRVTLSVRPEPSGSAASSRVASLDRNELGGHRPAARLPRQPDPPGGRDQRGRRRVGRPAGRGGRRPGARLDGRRALVAVDHQRLGREPGSTGRVSCHDGHVDPLPVDLLVRHAYVITMDDDGTLIPDGAIAIVGPATSWPSARTERWPVGRAPRASSTPRARRSTRARRDAPARLVPDLSAAPCPTSSARSTSSPPSSTTSTSVVTAEEEELGCLLVLAGDDPQRHDLLPRGGHHPRAGGRCAGRANGRHPRRPRRRLHHRPGGRLRPGQGGARHRRPSSPGRPRTWTRRSRGWAASCAATTTPTPSSGATSPSSAWGPRREALLLEAKRRADAGGRRAQHAPRLQPGRHRGRPRALRPRPARSPRGHRRAGPEHHARPRQPPHRRRVRGAPGAAVRASPGCRPAR